MLRYLRHNFSGLSRLHMIVLISFSSLTFPNYIFSQKSLYPKDTIYIAFDKTIKDGFNLKREVIYRGISGIKFSITTQTGPVSVFYDSEQSIDTISPFEVSKYFTVDRKEITRLHNLWIENPDGENHRPPGARNEVFETFVLERVSNGVYLKYPVTWL